MATTIQSRVRDLVILEQTAIQLNDAEKAEQRARLLSLSIIAFRIGLISVSQLNSAIQYFRAPDRDTEPNLQIPNTGKGIELTELRGAALEVLIDVLTLSYMASVGRLPQELIVRMMETELKLREFGIEVSGFDDNSSWFRRSYDRFMWILSPALYPLLDMVAGDDWDRASLSLNAAEYVDYLHRSKGTPEASIPNGHLANTPTVLVRRALSNSDTTTAASLMVIMARTWLPTSTNVANWTSPAYSRSRGRTVQTSSLRTLRAAASVGARSGSILPSLPATKKSLTSAKLGL